MLKIISQCEQKNLNHDNISLHISVLQKKKKKKLTVPSAGEDVEQLELSDIVVGEFWKYFGHFLKS